MPIIKLDSETKQDLEALMLQEIKKEISDPKIFIQAIKTKYGYSYNDFIVKLIQFRKKHRREEF